MTTTAEALSAQAAQLPPAERIELVDRILDSLDQTDGATDALWAEEAGDRLAAYQRSEIKAVALFDVVEKHITANTTAASDPITPASDPAQAALAALTRAGLRAAEDAKRANKLMVVAENGKIVRVSPQAYLRSGSEQPLPSNDKAGA